MSEVIESNECCVKIAQNSNQISISNPYFMTQGNLKMCSCVHSPSFPFR